MGRVLPGRSSRQEGLDQDPPLAPDEGLGRLRAPLGAEDPLVPGSLGVGPQLGQVVGDQLLLHLHVHVVFTSST
jgi:hypothetical protein